MKAGDTLIVWKLDRLGRSLSHLLEIISTLKAKDVAFRSLKGGMSKAAVCRNFNVKRSALIDTLARVRGADAVNKVL